MADRTKPQISESEAELAPSVGRAYYLAGAAISFLTALVVFSRTVAPSLTFWDAGEFIAAAYTLGVPHSPGTPLYVLLGKVATMLPLPLSIAGRVNFLSVLGGVGGALMMYVLVVRFLDFIVGKSKDLTGTLIKVSAGLVGALFITFSNTYWANSTESEVYALSTFIMGVITWAGIRWADNPIGPKSRSYIYLLFYLMALSVGLHLGTVLGFAGLFFFILMTKDKSFTNTDFLLACAGMAIFMADVTLYRAGNVTVVLLAIFAVVLVLYRRRTGSNFPIVCTLLFVLGITLHLFLYIRSHHNPLIDEANPETWRNLYAVLRREQYPTINVFERKASLLWQVQHFYEYFQAQFRMTTAFWGNFNVGSLIPLALGVWGIVDHWRHRKTFVMLFVTFLVMSVGMIFYLNFSDAEVRERDYFYLPAFYYFAVFIGIGAGSFLSEVRSFLQRNGIGGKAPVAAACAVLVALPIFTAKEHYHSHDRSRDYTCAAYARNMLVGLEENAVMFTNGDNDTFPLWYIQEVEGYRTDVRVVNLSLLQTPWYIHQLKNNEPQLEIQWSNEEIANIRPVLTDDGIVYVRDLAVNHILRTVARHRPIYFAVTIPSNLFAPYRQYLEMEGLAYRLVGREGANMVNLEQLEKNVWENWDFQNLLTEDYKRDETSYRAPFVARLVQNYAAAFAQLSLSRASEGNFKEAVRGLEVALEIAPRMDIATYWLGWYYFEAGDTTRALEFYDEVIEQRPDMVDLRYRKAGVLERINDYEGAVVTLEELIRLEPNHRDATYSAVGILIQMGEVDRAFAHIDSWVARHPNDSEMIEARDKILAKVRELSGQGTPDESGE